MHAFLKYMGFFFLMVIAGSLALLAVGIYQTFGKINAFFAGADTYTCGQFLTDLESDGTSKVYPVVLGTLAYGGSFEKADFEAEVKKEGVVPGLQKMVAACRATPDVKVFDLFAKAVVAPAADGASGTVVVSATAVVSGTHAISSTDKK